MSKDDNHLVALLEDMNGKLDTVVEAVGQLQDKVDTLSTRDEFNRLETKVDTIEAAVTDTNKDPRSLDSRVTLLEQSA
jgi:hypothetical protein